MKTLPHREQAIVDGVWGGSLSTYGKSGITPLPIEGEFVLGMQRRLGCPLIRCSEENRRD